MKRKLVLAGMLVVVLALGIVLLSCGGPSPFVGTWTDTDNSNIKLIFTETDYKYQVSGITTASGKYTFSGKEASLKVGSTSVTYATAEIDGDTLILTSIVGIEMGTFKK